MGAGVRLGGLWWKKGQDGKEFLEGQLGMATIRVFINDRKTTDRSPDASMVLTEKPKTGAGGGGGGQNRYPNQQQGRGDARGQHPYAPKPKQDAPRGGPPGAPPWPEEEDLGY